MMATSKATAAAMTPMAKEVLIMDVIVGVRGIVVTFGEMSTSLVDVGTVVFAVEQEVLVGLVIDGQSGGRGVTPIDLF